MSVHIHIQSYTYLYIMYSYQNFYYWWQGEFFMGDRVNSLSYNGYKSLRHKKGLT